MIKFDLPKFDLRRPEKPHRSVAHPVTNESVRGILAALEPTSRDSVLCICGSGDLPFAFASYGAHVVAYDISPSQVEYAKQRKELLRKGDIQGFLDTGKSELAQVEVDSKAERDAFFLEDGRLEAITASLDRIELYVDGTLVKGSIGVDFINWLAARNIFPSKQQEAIRAAVQQHEEGRICYQERGKQIIEGWAAGFMGTPESVIRREAREFIEHYDHIRTGAHELVSKFKARNYHIIAISRALEEVLVPFGKILGFDSSVGTRLEVRKGVYTGRLVNRMWEPSAKVEALRQLTSKFQLLPDNSFAFGDTEEDARIMMLVPSPFCLNASSELKKIATERNWEMGTISSVLENLAKRSF